MVGTNYKFGTDFGKILDFTDAGAADIFNANVVPRTNSLSSVVEDTLRDYDQAAESRQERRQIQFREDLLQDQQDDAFLAEMSSTHNEVAPVIEEDYNLPVSPRSSDSNASLPKASVKSNQPQKGQQHIKLANYGYSSDTSPDYNSNVLKIGHANNKLEDGVSAALTKSLAKRYGLKTGQFFEITTADGKTMTRRYDDTVPTTYKGKPLPETVDLYELGGSNKFGGTVVSIRPIE